MALHDINLCPTTDESCDRDCAMTCLIVADEEAAQARRDEEEFYTPQLSPERLAYIEHEVDAGTPRSDFYAELVAGMKNAYEIMDSMVPMEQC